MTAARFETLDVVPGQLSPHSAVNARHEAHATGRAPIAEAQPTVREGQKLSDAELAAPSPSAEAPLYGNDTGHYGGARGSEDAFQSYLEDIRGLSLLSRDEEAEKFDWRHGCRFGTYAGWWIHQAISRAAGDQSHLIHLPEHVAARLYKVRRVGSQLSQELGDEPSPEQIARAADMPVVEVSDLLRITEQPLSLDAIPEARAHLRLLEALEDPDAEASADVVSRQGASEELRDALGQLAQRERLIVMLRFGIGDGRMRTQREVGEELAISRERVRQIEGQALAKLRGACAARSLRESECLV